MKKIFSLIFCLVCVINLFSCTLSKEEEQTTAEETTVKEADRIVAPQTFEEFTAEAVDRKVCVCAYISATEEWWEDKITVYAVSETGSYYVPDANCSESQALYLEKGAAVRITGFKAEINGQVCIRDAEVVTYSADPIEISPVEISDISDARDDIKYQSAFVKVDGIKIEKSENSEAALFVENDNNGTDIVFSGSKDGKTYSFRINCNLSGSDSEVYNTASKMKAGDTFTVEGFLNKASGGDITVTALTIKK